LNGTHQLLAYTDDVNLFGKNINMTKKGIDALLDTSCKVDLEVNSEEFLYVYASSPQCRTRS